MLMGRQWMRWTRFMMDMLCAEWNNQHSKWVWFYIIEVLMCWSFAMRNNNSICIANMVSLSMGFSCKWRWHWLVWRVSWILFARSAFIVEWIALFGLDMCRVLIYWLTHFKRRCGHVSWSLLRHRIWLGFVWVGNHNIHNLWFSMCCKLIVWMIYVLDIAVVV